MKTVNITPISAVVRQFKFNDQFWPDAKPAIDMYAQICERLLRSAADDANRAQTARWQAAADSFKTLLDTYHIKKDI